MSNSSQELFRALVSDTLALIKEQMSQFKETKPESKLSSPLPKIEPVQTPIAREEPPPPPTQKPPLPKPPLQKKEPIFDLVRKHLPHIELIDEIPQPPKQQMLAILLFYQEDLPFIKKLANAIATHLCPVQIFDGEKLEKEKSWEKLQNHKEVFLLLTQREEIPSSLPQIFLSSASNYENNPEEKKTLWKTLCQQVPQRLHSSS